MANEENPQKFIATPEHVQLTQPEEVRKLLTEELSEIEKEVEAMKDQGNPSGEFTGICMIFGMLIGTIASVLSQGEVNIGVGTGVGLSMGTSLGAAIELLIKQRFIQAAGKLKEIRIDHFSKRVWAALPVEEQDHIKAESK